MIRYEELVAALTRWRARRGLPTGVADYLGESAAGSMGVADPIEHWPAHGAPAAAGSGRDDVVEVGDEMLENIEEVHERAYSLPDSRDVNYLGSPAGAGRSIDRPRGRDRHDRELALGDEATRPAGLAGISHPVSEAGFAPPTGRKDDGQAESRTPDAGHSRGRRRRK